MNLSITYNAPFVQEHYNKKYSNYHMLPGFDWEKRKVEVVFGFLFKQAGIVPGEKYFIDLGCGIGTKTYILSKYFRYSKGLDFSPHAIQIARLLNDNPELMFEEADIRQSSFEIRYDVVTALGLSILNVSSIDTLVSEITLITDNFMKRSGMLIINSFTDFSGTAPTGWYCHTRKELKQLKRVLKENGFKATIIFPHRHASFYVHLGVAALVEWMRLIISRRRQYYLIVRRNA